MSANLLLIGDNFDDSVQIDETSGSKPHTDFGKFFVPFIGKKINDKFIKEVKESFENEKKDNKDYLKIDEILAFLKKHRGELLKAECY